MYAGGLGAVLQLDGVGQGDGVMVPIQLGLVGVPGDQAVALFQDAVGNAGHLGAALHHGEIGAHGVPNHGGDVGGDVLHGLVQLGVAVGQQGVVGIGGQVVEVVAGEGEAHSVDDAVFVLEVGGGLAGIAVVRVAVGHDHQHLAGGAALELVNAQRHAGRQVGAALGNQIIQLGLCNYLGLLISSLIHAVVILTAVRGEDNKLGGELAAQLLSQGAHHVLDGGDGDFQAGFGLAALHHAAGIAAAGVIMVVLHLAAGIAAAAVVVLHFVAGQVVVRTPAQAAVCAELMYPNEAKLLPVVRMILSCTLSIAVIPVSVLLQAAVITAVGGVAVLLGAPGHGAGHVQDKGNLKGLLFNLDVVNLSRQFDFPLVGGNTLGVLGQNHLGVALAGLSTIYIIILAAGGQGVIPRGQHAHGQQAHDHSRGEQGCQKSLGLFCQHFHSPFGENGSAAAGRAWRSGLRFSLQALRPGFSAGLPFVGSIVRSPPSFPKAGRGFSPCWFAFLPLLLGLPGLRLIFFCFPPRFLLLDCLLH